MFFEAFVICLILTSSKAFIPNKLKKSASRCRQDTSLGIDVFGLGPPEVAVVAIVGFLLFGPEKVKEQLRNSGVEGNLVQSDDPIDERQKRIRAMQKYAAKKRNERAWERVNAAIENEDVNTIEKLESFKSKNRNDQGGLQ